MSMAGSSAAWMIPTMSYSRRKKVKGQQNGDEPQEDDWEEVSRVVDKATDALAVQSAFTDLDPHREPLFNRFFFYMKLKGFNKCSIRQPV